MADNDNKQENKVECKLYHRRWFMLLILVCFSIGSSSQWIQYSIIANLIKKYYNVDDNAVNWTSMIFMIVYVPLVFPASHFQDKVGLRWPMIIGTFGTAAGACIKVGSAGQDLFWVTFLGQALVAMAQVFMLSMPPVIAAVWFGEKEVSTACSIGVFGNQVGVILGFLIPPMMVQDSKYPEDIGDDLLSLYWMNAGYNTAVFILTVLFFQSKPPIPPSPQQAMMKENTAGNEVGFFSSMKRLSLNKSYILILVAYCMNQAVFNSFSTLLNQIMEQYSYDKPEVISGTIGVVAIAAGLVGAIVFGVILDRTRRYKLNAFIVYLLTLAGMIAVTYTLPTRSEIAVYLTSSFLGFFLVAYISIAYDFAMEVTYPEPEGVTAGYITLAYQLVSWLATMGYGEMVPAVGAEWSNNTLSFILLIGTIMHAIIKPDLKRQAAYSSTTKLAET